MRTSTAVAGRSVLLAAAAPPGGAVPPAVEEQQKAARRALAQRLELLVIVGRIERLQLFHTRKLEHGRADAPVVAFFYDR